ncbi:MAG: alpha/beta hydrolase [Myxococcales bacterium]|nr:alpha/beta hydrolase [Myxococcales bacterium]
MSLLAVLLLIVVFLFVWYDLARRFYGGRGTEDEIQFVTTDDGWRLALHRYRPRGANPHGEPVLLHHGLASNYRSFDLNVDSPAAPVPSLPHWLAERGYDVYAIDLRGRGDSERAGWGTDKTWTWSVDDYIEKDDPAFVQAILARTGFTDLHWIGHSMGGILLLAHCAREGSPRLASGIAVGSGLAYQNTGSHYERLIPFAGVTRYKKRFPFGSMAKFFAPFAGWKKIGLDTFNYCPENTAPAAAKAIYGGVICNTSSLVVRQMASLFGADGLTSLDGKIRYPEIAKNVTTPLLLIAGSRDHQSSIALADRTLKQLAGEQHKTLFFGKDHGHRENYGHFDLLVGLHAETEVFPHILEWLQSHPAKRAAGKTGSEA